MNNVTSRDSTTIARVLEEFFASQNVKPVKR